MIEKGSLLAKGAFLLPNNCSIHLSAYRQGASLRIKPVQVTVYKRLKQKRQGRCYYLSAIDNSHTIKFSLTNIGSPMFIDPIS